MSFSGEVKKELVRRIGKGRHCQIAELAALFAFDKRLEESENPILKEKYLRLAEQLLPKSDPHSKETKWKLLEIVKMWDRDEALPKMSCTVNGLLIQQTCCRRAYIRGAFLAGGSMSDPHKSYHFEIVCADSQQAGQLKEVINNFDMEAKIVQRKKHQVVYLKEGSQIVDILNVMEAHVALMDLENVRILKDMRNSVNRKVNCETANITKTVGAAVKQIEDINYIKGHAGLSVLPDNLREIAMLRLKYPDAPLKELGTYLNPPIGKSGVNHRLRRIGEIADGLRS